MKMKNYLKKKNQLRYQKFLVYLKIYNYFKNMVEENISLEFKLKNIDEARNYLTEEINRNELINKKHKKIFATLNHIESFLIFGFIINVSQFLLLLIQSVCQ